MTVVRILRHIPTSILRQRLSGNIVDPCLLLFSVFVLNINTAEAQTWIPDTNIQQCLTEKLKYNNSSVVGRQGLQALLCWPKHVNKLFFKVAMFMSYYIHRVVLIPVLYMIEYSNRISASLCRGVL